MSDLEALEAIAALGLLADDIEDGIDELGTLGVVSFRPVVMMMRITPRAYFGVLGGTPRGAYSVSVCEMQRAARRVAAT